ncbi:hypothetical protein DI53_0363 [Sphingobacterium deserti]|uniref:Uncharacterized protein n=1 Tax=Sphingobacterium deserti TaxID=1229276 RepID=A0A0B8TAM0_9SPHI|nr:hypothetical protein DI53_0363 [Sphingobacterium deserti]
MREDRSLALVYNLFNYDTNLIVVRSQSEYLQRNTCFFNERHLYWFLSCGGWQDFHNEFEKNERWHIIFPLKTLNCKEHLITMDVFSRQYCFHSLNSEDIA